MLFSSDQIKQLLNVVRYHIIIFGIENFGKEGIDSEDIKLLESFGIDYTAIPENNYINTAYLFGVLSKAIAQAEIKEMKYHDFKKWIERGGLIPLTAEEQTTVSYLKKNSFSYLKKLGHKIEADSHQMILDQENKYRLKTQELIRKELSEAVRDRTAFKEVMSNLGKKTEDWQRDWGRIVQTELSTAYQEGRADEIQNRNPKKDPLVFKHVRPTACRHCIQAYLTNGLGSKPIVFKLSQLRANGTNIGRKQQDWKAVVGCTHPWCYCELDEVPEGYEWNEDKQMFVPPENYERKIQRKGRAYITIGDVEYVV